MLDLLLMATDDIITIAVAAGIVVICLIVALAGGIKSCLLYTSPSPRDTR